MTDTAWRPISTAPKDGTMIILAELDGGGDIKHIDPGNWDLIDEGWESNIKPYYGWTSNTWPFDDEGPTHWIPLPTPPQAPQTTTDGSLQSAGSNAADAAAQAERGE